MFNLSALMRQHTELIRRTMKLGQFAAGPRPESLDELMATLQGFSELLLSHLQDEDENLYPALCNSPVARLAQTAQSFIAEMGDQADLWLGYHATWSRSAILKDWAGFCAATEEMMERISHRIVRENRMLFPLIDRRKDRAAA